MALWVCKYTFILGGLVVDGKYSLLYFELPNTLSGQVGFHLPKSCLPITALGGRAEQSPGSNQPLSQVLDSIAGALVGRPGYC